MPRRIEVEIKGDPKDLGRALAMSRLMLREFSSDANRNLASMRHESDGTSISVRRLGDELDKEGNKAQAAGRKHKDLGIAFHYIRDELLLLAVPAVSGVIPMLLNGISALGSGAVSLASAIAPSVGALVSLGAAMSPAALGAISLGQGLLAGTQAVSVFGLATLGLGKILKDAFTPGDEAAKKLKKDLNDVPRALQPVANQVARLRPLFEQLQNAAARPIGASLVDSIRVVLPLFRPLQQYVSATATVLGDLIERANRVVASPLFRTTFTAVLRNNTAALRALGAPAIAFGRSLLYVVQAAQPLFTYLVRLAAAGLRFATSLVLAAQQTGLLTRVFSSAQTVIGQLLRIVLDVGAVLATVFRASLPSGQLLLRQIVQLADRFREWGTSVEVFGQMRQFFAEARTSLSQLARIAYNLGVVLVAVFTGGHQSGKFLLDQLVRLTATWREWAQSLQGRSQIARWFEEGRPTVMAVARLVGDLAAALFRLSRSPSFGPVVEEIRTKMLPALETLISTYAAMGPRLVASVSGIIRLLGVLAKDFAFLNGFAQVLGVIINQLAQWAETNPEFRSFLATIVQIALIAKTLSFASQVLQLRGMVRAIGEARAMVVGFAAGMRGLEAAGKAGRYAEVGQELRRAALAARSFAVNTVTGIADVARAWGTMLAADARAVGGMVAANARAFAGMVAQAARATASVLVSFARIAAGWAVMAAQSLAAAARIAIAQIIAFGWIALVIIAVGVLVYVIVRNWDTIKRVTIAVWTAVSGWVVRKAKEAFDWIKRNWPLLLAILTGPLGVAVLIIVRNWDRIKNVAIAAFSVVIRVFLNFVGTIISGAARAFGWVPGLGGKLRTAAASFDQFKNRVNASLDRIRDKKVDVTASTKVDPNVLKVFTAAGGRVRMMARGGRVNEGTTPTADDVLVRVSRKETVVSAGDSDDPWFKAWASHKRIPGFAGGGRVETRFAFGRDVVPAYVGMRDRASALMVGAVSRAAQAMQQMSVGGPADVRAVALWTLAALRRGIGELGAWMRRLLFESGGNASVVNRSDVNWQQGHPSVGIAQVIRGTFAAYAGPYRNVGPFLYGVSINPRANSYAGANYAISRYGSLYAVDPNVRHAGYRTGLWQALGDQLAMIHRGEMVAPPEIATLARRVAARPSTAARQLQPVPRRQGTIVLELNGRRFASAIIDDLDDVVGSRVRLN
jgi:hypothetical protein